MGEPDAGPRWGRLNYVPAGWRRVGSAAVSGVRPRSGPAVFADAATGDDEINSPGFTGIHDWTVQATDVDGVPKVETQVKSLIPGAESGSSGSALTSEQNEPHKS